MHLPAADRLMTMEGRPCPESCLLRSRCSVRDGSIVIEYLLSDGLCPVPADHSEVEFRAWVTRELAATARYAVLNFMN